METENILKINQKITLQDEYIKYLSVTHSQNTIKSYVADISGYMNFVNKNNLAFDDDKTIAAYKNHLENKLSLSSIVRKLYSIRNYMEWLNNGEKVKINIPNRQVNKPEPSISINDVQNIFKILYSNLEYANKIGNKQKKALTIRDIAIFELMMSTGIRITELISIKGEDINFGKQLLTVKGNQYPRTLKITNKTYDAITAYAITFQRTFKDYFFVNSRGRPFTADTINKVIMGYFNQAELSNCTPRMLRQLAIKSLYEKKIPPETIERMIGQRYINNSKIVDIPD